MTQALQTVYERDALALQTFAGPLDWTVRPYAYGEHVFYFDVCIASQTVGTQFALIRVDQGHLGVKSHLEVVKLASPQAFVTDPDLLKPRFTSFVMFAWNEHSTVVRALLHASHFLRSLEAEARVTAQGGGRAVAPEGLMVVHNTHEGAIQSIVDNGGILLRFGRSGRAIWSRPLSYGNMENTRFTGDYSIVADVSGLPLQSVSADAVVIGADIPLRRFVRVVHLGLGRD